MDKAKIATSEEVIFYEERKGLAALPNGFLRRGFLLVFLLVVNHLFGVPWCGIAAQILVKPFQMSVVIDQHGGAAGPVTVVVEDDEA